MFVGLQNMRDIDISQNAIVYIEKCIFFGMSNLDHLNLSFIYIKTIYTLSSNKYVNIDLIGNIDIEYIVLSSFYKSNIIYFSKQIYCYYFIDTQCIVHNKDNDRLLQSYQLDVGNKKQHISMCIITFLTLIIVAYNIMLDKMLQMR